MAIMGGKYIVESVSQGPEGKVGILRFCPGTQGYVEVLHSGGRRGRDLVVTVDCKGIVLAVVNVKK